MRKLAAFIQVSLDGYFADADGGIGWAHKDPGDGEWNAFVADNARGGGQLLFGRITYEFMAGYWPTPMAAANNPVVAERMNAMPKIVFSRTLDEAAWANTTLVNGDLVAKVRKLKKDTGPDMAILGSGSLVSQLAEAGLVDEFQIVVNPVVLGRGQALFDGIRDSLSLKLTSTHRFANGSVFLRYEPAG
jgi:dihydrofolate reductase